MTTKHRLDKYLITHQYCDSLSEAQSMIMQGKVLVDDHKITKAGTPIKPGATIRLLGTSIPYVSRGGLKIESAWTQLNFSIQDTIALDVGISTGGFTDFLLQHGARHVVGIDVGYGITHPKIREHPSTTVIERTNAREISKDTCNTSPYPISEINLVVADLSFISVTKVLPTIATLVHPDCQFIILIKPQFEATKSEVGNGIISDETLRNAIIDRTTTALHKSGFRIRTTCDSTTHGPKGNRETFAWMTYEEA